MASKWPEKRFPTPFLSPHNSYSFSTAFSVRNILRVYGHTFVADWIDASSIVLDLGANRGIFSQEAANVFGCRILGVEADPELYSRLPSISNFTAVNAAIAGTNGEVRLNRFQRHCASIAITRIEGDQPETVRVRSITLASLLSAHHVDKVDLIKCDIEGAEINVFRNVDDELLCRIGQLTIEFHDFIDPSQSGEVHRLWQRLVDLGFYGLDFSRNRMDVLFINTRLHPLSPMFKLQLLATKYARGVKRIGARVFGVPDGGSAGYKSHEPRRSVTETEKSAPKIS